MGEQISANVQTRIDQHIVEININRDPISSNFKNTI